MAAEPLITTYLEMRSRDQLRPKRADARFQVREKRNRDWQFNRDLYFRVGEQWDWIDKRPWTDEQWKEYGLAPELRTFGAYHGDSLSLPLQLLDSATFGSGVMHLTYAKA